MIGGVAALVRAFGRRVRRVSPPTPQPKPPARRSRTKMLRDYEDKMLRPTEDKAR